MMITKSGLIEKVRAYIPELDVKLLEKACDYSKEAHGTQKRASGDPYYHHPLEVAYILADIKLDLASIITALLHDTVEDTSVTLDEIEKEFGKEIRNLVDGVTKLAKIEFQSEHTRQAENFRKLLVAMSEDIRVLLVKLADRLHNMRTLHYIKSPEKRMRVAHETMEIYSPLAERIGMQQLKNEMQDLAFAELHPEMRESIVSRLEYLKNKGGTIVDVILKEIEKTLTEAGIKANVVGRTKTPCSIWRKMDRKNISFEQLSDIMAFRIITKTIPECYQILGAIHSNYKMIPENFKDFISTPKENGYRSLHTVIMGPEQRFIEIQIRTQEMHEISELGVAAHWSYKQERDYSTDGKQYKWVRELLYILEHTSDPEEFLENTKLEMYYDQVFCFTPKGELIALPKGATPVDFAYEVHSKVGNHCSGAKVNGRIVPLRTQLYNGDQVEIITSKTQSPSPAWESFAITGKAKSEIKRFVRARKREEYVKLGRFMLEKDFKEMSKKKFSDKVVEPSLEILKRKTVLDIYASIGEGNLPTSDALKAIFPDKKLPTKRGNPLSLLSFTKDRRNKSEAIPIKGLTPGMAVYFAECCHPIPGDTIVGVVTTGKGMTIHTSDCEMLGNFASTPERLVDVSWGRDTGEKGHIGRIKVTLVHEAGSLAALADIVSKDNGNISNLKITDRTPEFFEMVLDIGVRGAKHLSSIITSLRTNPHIHSAERYKQ
jgi:guanosine-3',5'-bis(diphosphate) 3'-pyrophosphohydrolase